jgi:two-component system C4-dicarboxylate transport sensor histidine kinase DctB
MRRKMLLLVSLLLLLALLAGAGWRVGLSAALAALEAEADRRLEAAAARLEGRLDRYRQLPTVLADTGPFAATMAAPTSDALRRANLILQRIADVTGALDIYLMDATGQTLAHSNWASELTFIGRNFAYRPYFQRAATGGLGVYYALGATSGQRGFYFASPLRDGGRLVGVIAVKVDLESIEADWRAEQELIYFTDPDGVVFIANRAEMLFHATLPLAEAARARIADGRRYNGVPIPALPSLPADTLIGGDVVRLDPDARAAFGADAAHALSRSLDFPRLDLTAHVLIDASPALAQARTAGLLTAAAALVLTLASLLILQRRAALRAQLRIKEQATAQLERRVEDRTRDLSDAYRRMEQEVAERRAAEARLRRTQDDLVQAGKLSALGQMSAGISHELNQPLAAIRSFADNARVFLARDRAAEADANLGQISDLTSRMARIIRNLRSFARKEGEPATAVALDRVVADALELLHRRIAEEGAAIAWKPPEAPMLVHGGDVRLQQVVVNILANALDAMKASAEKRIEIDLRPGPPVRLTIRDTGPGLTEEAREKLFDPFFTTKSVGEGEGLGLGLSISYGIVQSFGGAIHAAAHPQGGAVFTIDLPPGAREAAA